MMNDYHARLEIRSTPAQLQIRSKQIRFRVNREMPRMTVHRRMPQFRVNWAKVRAENGLAGPSALSQQMRDRAHSMVMESIARVAQNGDLMMRTENYSSSTDMVAEIAYNNMEAAMSPPEINVQMKSLPEMEWDAGEFQISWSQGKFNIEWETDFMPDINVTPHSVEIKVRNYPKRKVSEGRVPQSKVDKRI